MQYLNQLICMFPLASFLQIINRYRQSYYTITENYRLLLGNINWGIRKFMQEAWSYIFVSMNFFLYLMNLVYVINNTIFCNMFFNLSFITIIISIVNLKSLSVIRVWAEMERFTLTSSCELSFYHKWFLFELTEKLIFFIYLFFYFYLTSGITIIHNNNNIVIVRIHIII